MIVKETYSTPEALDFDAEGIGNGSGKFIAGPCELSFIKLTSISAGSSVVRVFDTPDGGAENNATLKLVMDAAADNPDVQTFSSPLMFTRGVSVLLNQGANLGAVLSYAVIMPK